MPKKNSKTTSHPAADTTSNKPRTKGDLLLAPLRLLTSSRFLIPALCLCIIAQIIIFGLALNARLSAYVQRMEIVQNKALDLALVQAAEMEAQSLAKLIPNKGSASVGQLPPRPDSEEEAPQDSHAASNSAPDLRPRDIDTIINQETDALIEEFEREQAAALSPADNNDDTAGLSSVNEELDRLIREGINALVAGDMRRCILNFEQARSINPRHPAMLYYYGMAYDKLLNPNKAREYYTELYQMRDSAGKYFDRAAKRLTYGFGTAAAKRGKLAFGPHLERNTKINGDETVEVIVPVLLANDEDLNPEDIYIHIQFFDLQQGSKVALAETAPVLIWENPTPTWDEQEEKLIAQYSISTLEQSYATKRYYGFTAKLYYKGEPMDCISSPSALILHENSLNRASGNSYNNILPDDGLDNSYDSYGGGFESGYDSIYEEAIPFSEVEEIP